MKPFFLIAGALVFFASTTARAEYCREFTQTIRVGNQKQEGVGTACMQADGSWQIVSPARIHAEAPPPQTIIIHEPPRRVYRPRPVYYGITWKEPRYRYHRHHHDHGRDYGRRGRW